MEKPFVTDSIEQERLIELINRLAKKKRESGLSPEEEKLQKSAYEVYLKRIRQQFDSQLDSVKIKNADGSLIPFKKYAGLSKGKNEKQL